MPDRDSTTDDVLAGVDLTGKRALVTGVSAGLGVETARALLSRGAMVIGTARDLEKARNATSGLSADEAGRLQLVELDLASLDSVRQCADALLRAGEPLHYVIANAGIMATPYGKTQDGFELQFGTNYLGHFLLANRLAELMPEGARLIVLSSSAHHFGDVDLDDLNFERRAYDPTSSYAASKTASTLFVVEFDRRHKDRGVRAVAVHPGVIATELMRYMDEAELQKMTLAALANMGTDDPSQMRMKSIPQGAATTVWAATAPAETVGGRYCEDCHVSEIASSGGEGVRPYALDTDRAAQLWDLSEKLVETKFPAPA